ncbi:putative maltase-glucoamylase 2 [Babylonia areolata]|uniref:putative maltase-glucoamylase 2 n=1 Tax=Babylonia areolata TaxID=304850 RepID=UPI003FD6B814
MNEPTAFGTNEDRPFNWPEGVKPYWSLTCPVSNLDDPPYRTGAAFGFDTPSRRGRLSDKTLCLSAVQGQHHQYRHYDVHSLYGWSQTEPTLQALREAISERGVVVTRSTFVGSGHYAGHWLGDNTSGWKDLRASIVGIQEFNLFGITYTGADICGHFGTATPELCKRWMQLGAFYTFSRNHNAIGNRDQDPGNFDEEVRRVVREAMVTRYWLLPYLYTLMHLSHVHGSTVIRPVHHEFSTDQTALDLNEQFMWGAGLLISPIVYPNATQLKYYLPEGRWYDYYSGSLLTETGQTHRTISVQSDTRIQLSVRGGHILPLQQAARNTTYSRRNPMRLMVALSAEDRDEGFAEGCLFWDDGVSIDVV